MRKGEQTRQEIIRKAAPIFNQKGYDGAALSDLMRATGLEKGGIYRHFESKEELAGDAFDHAWKIAMDALRDTGQLALLLPQRLLARPRLCAWAAGLRTRCRIYLCMLNHVPRQRRISLQNFFRGCTPLNHLGD